MGYFAEKGRSGERFRVLTVTALEAVSLKSGNHSLLSGVPDWKGWDIPVWVVGIECLFVRGFFVFCRVAAARTASRGCGECFRGIK